MNALQYLDSLIAGLSVSNIGVQAAELRFLRFLISGSDHPTMNEILAHKAHHLEPHPEFHL